MPVLAAVNIRHAFGERIILEGVSISIEPGERVGIVGRNGTGKSTLLRILTGEITPDAGMVSIQRGSRAGYLRQDPNLDPTETLRGAAEGAFAELHRLHKELEELYERMATAAGPDLDRLLKQQERLDRDIEAAGGYAVDHKIDAVLHGLGFTDAQFGIPVAGLSGGQKGRLALAKLLLESPDLLLLDEPTNHLDLDGRLWLEDFLAREYRGAVLMISHDRYLLDHVVNRILEVEDGRLVDYPGNYAKFRELRAERRLAMARAYENQQTKFKKEEEFIRRYKAGQRAKQARGRQTKLERAKDDRLERPMDVGVMAFELPKSPRTGDIVVGARGISKTYQNDDGSEKVLFSGLDLSISRGERWGIVGPNGAGKTTLVRCLLGDLAPDTGTVRLGSNVIPGYYRQTQEGIDPDMQVYRYLQGVILKELPERPMSEQQARNLAGAFLFTGEEQERPMGQLSGGERSRAVLAGLLASAKNVLVLDEPTNHLDIPSAERLEEALALGDEDDDGGYDGTMLLISHDRALIDATCDHLLVMDGQGGAKVFLGNWTQWHERELELQRTRQREEAERQRGRDDQERRRREAEAAKQRAAPAADPARPLGKLKTEQIEQRIERAEARIREIDTLLGEPDAWKDAVRCAELAGERERLAAELGPLEEEWAQRAGLA